MQKIHRLESFHAIESMLLVQPIPAQAPTLHLQPETEAAVLDIIDEHLACDALQLAGLRPARRILFFGPPGTGKTSAALWLSHALRRRIAFADSHKLVGSHMGESSAAIAKLFEAAQSFDGILFFDEIDSLGSIRQPGTDGASREMATVVNTLLTQMERDAGDSVLIAATNRRDLLDRALLRRFDAVVEFPRPSPRQLFRMIELDAAMLSLGVRQRIHAEAISQDWLHAEIATAILRERKREVLATYGRRAKK